MDERNAQQPFPLILTGPAGSEQYFNAIDEFIGATLGASAQNKYQIIIDDPVEVARTMRTGLEKVGQYRLAMGDAFSFNWSLKINPQFQQPFNPTHQSMSELELHHNQDVADLAMVLRKAFSGIVTGNVKAEGIKQIKQHGPFKLTGERELMTRIDGLLRSFVAQQRMKLPGSEYQPCYTINKSDH